MPRPRLLGADDLAPILEVLQAGRIVGLPTDTVYGLAGRLDQESVDRIFAAKGRPADLALPVLVGERTQVRLVAASFGAAASSLADRFWPGPLTVVVRAKRAVGALVGGDGKTVGIRWPNAPLVEELCLAAGPLAVTSANRHGERPGTSAWEVAERFDAEAVAAVVEGGQRVGIPSSVVDCSGGRPRCLRIGTLQWSEIESALAD